MFFDDEEFRSLAAAQKKITSTFSHFSHSIFVFFFFWFISGFATSERVAALAMLEMNASCSMGFSGRFWTKAITITRTCSCLSLFVCLCVCVLQLHSHTELKLAFPGWRWFFYRTVWWTSRPTATPPAHPYREAHPEPELEPKPGSAIAAARFWLFL